MRTNLFLLTILASLLLCSLSHSREWTRNDGKQIQAKLISIMPDAIQVKLQNGKVYDLDLKTLVKEDQEYIKSLNKGNEEKIDVVEFGPRNIKFNAGDWSSPQNDADWQLKGNEVVRQRNGFNSSFQYNKIIPSGFACSLGIKLVGLKRGDGRGVCVTDANGKFISVTIGDTSPLGIWDSAQSGYTAISSNIKLKDEQKYDVEIRVKDGSVTANIEKQVLTTKWEGVPPYTISLFCQRSGIEVTDLSIKELE